MHEQKTSKTLHFFLVNLNNVDQLQQSLSSTELPNIEFEWEGFSFKSFPKESSLLCVY